MRGAGPRPGPAVVVSPRELGRRITKRVLRGLDKECDGVGAGVGVLVLVCDDTTERQSLYPKESATMRGSKFKNIPLLHSSDYVLPAALRKEQLFSLRQNKRCMQQA